MTDTIDFSHPTPLPQEFAKFAIYLAREVASPLINRAYNDTTLQVEQKPDRTPVTRADRDAEEAIRTAISKTFPGHGVIGEEFGTQRRDAEWVWVIDPIDGTLAFIHGVPLFTTLIGLLHRGLPVMGVIYQPTQDRLCIAYDGACFLNGMPVRCAPDVPWSDCTLLCTDFENVSRHQQRYCASFQEICKRTALNRTWADGYGYLLLATGRAHIMADPVVNPWDVLPILPIIQGSGAALSDWDGKRDINISSALAAPPALHARLIEELHNKKPAVSSVP